MAITLVVRSLEGEAPALTFDGTQRVVIGRGASCDVRIPDASVSQRHASIESRGAEFVVLDEGSTNGTSVGGVRVAPRTSRVLRTGDAVRVGRVWLEVKIDQAPITRDLANATREMALALVSQALRAVGEDTTARVVVVEGPDQGSTLALAEEGRLYTIGRAATCDLPLADPDASREHVTVVRRGTTVMVRDLASKNGAFLGEAPLDPGRDVVWKPTMMVRLARTVLALEEPLASTLLAIEQATDAPMTPEEIAAPPPPTLVSPVVAEPPPVSIPAAPERLAPIAPPSSSGGAPPTRPPRRRGWTVTDVLVMLAALAILGLSIAGLVWLFRT